MHEDNGKTTQTAGYARYGSTVKQRTAVQHIVRRLLDDLAPERQPARGAPAPSAVQRHRTPRGCILQGATGAVSVSWFPATVNEETLGELQVVVWRGVVARPGSANRAQGSAVALTELVLRPEEGAEGAEGDAWCWRAEDGRAFEPEALAERCRALFDEQEARAEPQLAAG